MSNDTLATRLRAETKALHTQAERSGAMGALLRGKSTRATYAAMLSSLAVIYDALETGLDSQAAHPAIAPLRMPGLERHARLLADLRALASAGTPTPPPAALAQDYAAHLQQLAVNDPPRLLAHAWLRYLGDLNGGQIVGRLVRDSLNLPADAATFYEFPSLGDPHAAAARWRSALESLALDADTEARIIAEACDGFRRHIALFNALSPTQDAAESSAE